MEINISFSWIPSHSNIKENKKADQRAKNASEYINSHFLNIIYIETKNQIKDPIKIIWRIHWQKQVKEKKNL